MNFFNSLSSNIQTNSDLLNFIGILCTVIVSIYIFKKDTSTPFIRERYEKLIFPLFNSLEPVLYQEVKPEYIKNSLQIIKDNKYLADGKLLELFYYCSQNQNPSQKNFNQLCSYVDKLYDKTCHRLGLKTRSISYRIMRHQYKHWSYFVFYILSIIILYFIALIASLLLFACLMACLYLIYKDANDVNKLIMLSIGTIFIFALLKYIDKHF